MQQNVTTSQSIPVESFAAFRQFLEQACGIVLGDNKDYLVVSRLNRLMQERGIANLDQLIEQATRPGNTVLRGLVVDAMTTNETMWFRDAHPYEILRSNILPSITEAKLSQLRIWSAGCSTGEEPYSMSMVIQEYLESRPLSLPSDIQIIATDISSSALEHARRGVYEDKNLLRGMSPERRRKFFVPAGEKWQVKPEIARRVRFQPLNLKESFVLLGRLDVIFCRNVLIYFSAELKRDIIDRMTRQLNPRGFLMLGASESLSGFSESFQMVRCTPGVIYRLKNY